MTCAKPADLKGEKVYLLDEMDVCPEEGWFVKSFVIFERCHSKYVFKVILVLVKCLQ